MRITVFISYSHDSTEHRQKVLALSNRLRADGIEVFLDQYLNGSPPQGWPRWMLDQLDGANVVLVVCTDTYYRRFRGHEAPGKGKGADWEGALITQELYDSRSHTSKFVPVFLSPALEAHIPEPLRSGTHYTLTSDAEYQRLYDVLLGQSGSEPQPIGALKPRPRSAGPVLTFTDSATPKVKPAEISRIVRYAPVELIGRESETALLTDAWAKVQTHDPKRPRVLTFVALGGEGKTSLVAKWAADLAAQDWPGCDAVFAWSFYSQGSREQTAVSSDLFLAEALTFFGDAELARSAQGAFDKGRRLAQLVGERRALLILDGLEPLQYAPTSPTPGELKDQGVAALLKGLATSSHGLCIVTTRYSVPDLKAFWQSTAPEVTLRRLSREAGVRLLKALGVMGSERRTLVLTDGDGRSETVSEFEKLVEDVKGHALTVSLLGSYVRDAHAGDIRKVGLVNLAEADAEEQGGHAFHVMDAYVQAFEREGEKGQRALAVLRLMALFDRPATAGCLEALWQPPAIAGLTEPLIGLSDAQRNLSLKRLEDAKLLTVNRAAGSGKLVALDAHPLMREYFARRVREQQSEAWRAAHRRLYEHLCASTREGDQPTLEALQPLYQAVAHGCQAGLQQETHDEVWFRRIRQGNNYYSTKKLGAFGSDLGAVACFFEAPWDRVSPELNTNDQSVLLNAAAVRLRALGRLNEALEPMRVSVEMGVKAEDWDEAARRAGNLSELELTLGEVAASVGDAEQSVTYADRSGDAFQRESERTAHADALHQAGRRAEAEARFREADQMQAERQPYYPLLYSLQGFQYCDLLMTEAERAAWQSGLLGVSPTTRTKAETGMPRTKRAQDERTLETTLAALRAVSERAAQTLKWTELAREASLLDIALEHLTLGRAALYAAILESSRADFGAPRVELGAAVAGLRRAGQQYLLPQGLLTRAWCSFAEASKHKLLNDGTQTEAFVESARSDLDEAWEIAERGPMPLILVDIHLHRARLFLREAEYPWESPQHDLAEARRLIEKHGYLRRLEELEDAEAALGLAPPASD